MPRAIFNQHEMLKARIHPWINTASWQPMWGVQVKRHSDKRWLHVAHGGRALLFSTEHEAEREAARMNERTSADNV